MLRCDMRTTVTINDDLYRSAKAAAAREGVSVGSLLEHALQAYLHAAAPERPAAPLPTFDSFAPAAGIDFTRTSDLLHELDQARS